MSDEQHDPSEDPWLTLAEFAEQMRVRPVTVRSWIAKGQLKATRGGQRKWLVRRSELERMLGQDQAASSSADHATPVTEAEWSDEVPDEVQDEIVAHAIVAAQLTRDGELARAMYEWDVALEQSRMAPPDARFPTRIRHIGQAAAQQSSAIRDCVEVDQQFAWTPISGGTEAALSYELRPGGNRPGPKDAWDRVDRVVARVTATMSETSASAVAGALGDLARALSDVANGIERRPVRAAEQGRADRDADSPSGPGGVL